MYPKRTIGWLFCWVAGLALVLAGPVQAQVRTLKAEAHGGHRYVALKDLAAMYGLPLTAPGGKNLFITGKYTSLQFTGDSRMAVVNGSRVWLHAPVTLVRGRWMLSDADAQFVIDPLVRPSAYLGARQTRTVILDAGHGGKDPGTCSRSGTLEKDLALDIALRVKAQLTAAGVRVVMTRDTDRFWELKDRTFIAARAGGDVFVSIHMNAAGSRTVQGIETYVTPAQNFPPTAEARLTGKYAAVPNNQFNHSNTVLGHQLQRAMVNITRADDRGLKRARFVVLRNSAMPAALIECGFLSNAQDAQRLATPSYRQTMAQGIAQGILGYLALVNRAKVELGAPLIQKPTDMAAAPVIPTPPVSAPVAPAPVVVPPPVVATPPPAVVSPVAAVPAVPAPAPVPAPVVATTPLPQSQPPLKPPAPLPPQPKQAIAPPPSKLLRPNLATTPP